MFALLNCSLFEIRSAHYSLPAISFSFWHPDKSNQFLFRESVLPCQITVRVLISSKLFESQLTIFSLGLIWVHWCHHKGVTDTLTLSGDDSDDWLMPLNIIAARANVVRSKSELRRHGPPRGEEIESSFDEMLCNKYSTLFTHQQHFCQILENNNNNNSSSLPWEWNLLQENAS